MRLIKIINVSFLILSFLSCTENNSNQGDKSEEESKTNILFIFADDWGWGDLSAHAYVRVLIG